MSKSFKPLNEQDGNQPGASRYADLATKIMLGGVVLDTDAIDFETLVRFRYRVKSFWPVWAVERQDKRHERRTMIAWFLTRRGAQSAVYQLNRASDLATEKGWL